MGHSRQKWVIGNWKLNPDFSTAKHLFHTIDSAASQRQGQTKVSVIPPAPYLAYLTEQATGIVLGAQDLSIVEHYGAFTGEYHAQLLASIGIQQVIVGHSERRVQFGDNVNIVKLKVQRALESQLQVIYCVGESLEHRERGLAETVVLQQIDDLFGIVNDQHWTQIIFAYEPIWAIGTGRTASAADAQSMHHAIREHLTRFAPQALNCSVVYGGSVKPDNARALARCADIDGVLVGGAALQANDFLAIVDAFNEL